MSRHATAESFCRCVLIWACYRWKANFVPTARGHMAQKPISTTSWVRLYEKAKNLNFPKISAPKPTENSCSTTTADCAGYHYENTAKQQKMPTTASLLWILFGNTHLMKNGFFRTNNTDRLCSFTESRQVHSLPLIMMVPNSLLLRLIKGWTRFMIYFFSMMPKINLRVTNLLSVFVTCGRASVNDTN